MIRCRWWGEAWRKGFRGIRRGAAPEVFDDYPTRFVCCHGVLIRPGFVDEEHGERDAACLGQGCRHLLTPGGGVGCFVDEEHED